MIFNLIEAIASGIYTRRQYLTRCHTSTTFNYSINVQSTTNDSSVSLLTPYMYTPFDLVHFFYLIHDYHCHARSKIIM